MRGHHQHREEMRPRPDCTCDLRNLIALDFLRGRCLQQRTHSGVGYLGWAFPGKITSEFDHSREDNAMPRQSDHSAQVHPQHDVLVVVLLLRQCCAYSTTFTLLPAIRHNEYLPGGTVGCPAQSGLIV